jgi:hypothetical protein
MDQTMLDQVEGMVIVATAEVVDAINRGASGEPLENCLEFIRATLFLEAATLTRSVDQAEAAVQRFAEKVASIQYCEKCQQHRVGGKCIACILERDLADIAAHNASVHA